MDSAKGLLRLYLAILMACAAASGAEWLTDGGNPERTAWQRDETFFTTDNVGETKLLWKIRLGQRAAADACLAPGLDRRKREHP